MKKTTATATAAIRTTYKKADHYDRYGVRKYAEQQYKAAAAAFYKAGAFYETLGMSYDARGCYGMARSAQNAIENTRRQRQPR